MNVIIGLGDFKSLTRLCWPTYFLVHREIFISCPEITSNVNWTLAVRNSLPFDLRSLLV